MITAERMQEIRHIAPTAGPLGQEAINELVRDADFARTTESALKDQIAGLEHDLAIAKDERDTFDALATENGRLATEAERERDELRAKVTRVRALADAADNAEFVRWAVHTRQIRAALDESDS